MKLLQPSQPGRWCSYASIVIATGLAGCGSGTAGLLAGGDDDDGGSGPSLTETRVIEPKVSPAGIELTASGSVGSTLQVELLYAAPGEELRPMEHLSGPGTAGNVVALPASPAGTPSTVAWDFATELGDAGLSSAVRVVARPPGSSVPASGDLTLDLGNDPPVVEEVSVPATEVALNVPIGLRLSDSSSDVITLVAEWRPSDDPGAPWQPATPAGLFPQGIETRPADQGGVELTFFWATGVDLDDLERDVIVRFTPDDRTLDAAGNPVGVGEPHESTSFRVDNNEEPIVTLDSGTLIVNPDQRRTIPVPFRVLDEEADAVHVFLQWRRPDEPFPALPSELSELEALQADPVLRSQHHLCTPAPRAAHGRVQPVDASRVRLPELGQQESWIAAGGFEGRTLELLRPSQAPASITADWSSNVLAGPVAALPMADGLTAIVVDAPGSASRVRELELATGRVVREIATFGPGTPSAAGFEGGEQAVLVAVDLGGAWAIERVDIGEGGGTVDTLYASSLGDAPAPVRAIASLGPKSLLLTAGTGLYGLDLGGPQPRLHTLHDDLATPWGIAVDPRVPSRVFVSEKSADRVLVFELDTHERIPAVIGSASLSFAGPRALALERRGARLLVVGDEAGAGLRLFGLDVIDDVASAPFPLGAPFATAVAGLSSGPDGLRLLALPEANELAAGGGVEQRRTLQGGEHPAHDPRTQSVSVSADFEPALRPGQPWRIASEGLLTTRSEGVSWTFCWDADADVPSGGEFVLRVIALDVEVGVPAEGVVPKPIRAALDVQPVLVDLAPEAVSPISITSADLNRDGRLDLVWADLTLDHVAVLHQSMSGGFDGAPLVLGDASLDGPQCVIASDVDADGNLDLVTANGDSGNLAVFFQDAVGAFGAPLVLGSPPALLGASAVVAADLDGDGDLDLASSNNYGACLTVFFQASPRVFAATPLELGPTVVDAEAVVSGDLDGDGDLDLCSANASTNELMVFFQTSPGRFDDPPAVLALPPSVSNQVVSLVAADLDADGDLDLVAGVEGSFDVFQQVAPGEFALATVLPLFFATPLTLLAADLDGNGALDLAATAFGAGLGVYFQRSPGVFDEAPLEHLLEPTLGLTWSVAAGDLDGDGDLDLASADLSQLAILYQDSPGRFGSGTTQLQSHPTFHFNYTPLAADLDGDGDMDVGVGTLGADDGLVVFHQDSPGRFDDAPLRIGAPWVEVAGACLAADLDGDGDLDLASANGFGTDPEPFADGVNVFFQSPSGAFDGQPLDLEPSPSHDDPRALVAADLDRDGDLDLASANIQDSSLTVFSQTTAGGFGATPLRLRANSMRGPSSLAAADLDGDGDVDLVSTNEDSDNLTVLFQSAPGSFVLPPTVLVPTPGAIDVPKSVFASDVDGDGDLDLTAALRFKDRLAVFFQGATGSFASPPLFLDPSPAVDGPVWVRGADLDRDGDLDLVSSNYSVGNLTAFFQSSPGSFEEPRLLLEYVPGNGGDQAFTLADLDADGDPEITLGSTNAVTISWGGR